MTRVTIKPSTKYDTEHIRTDVLDFIERQNISRVAFADLADLGLSRVLMALRGDGMTNRTARRLIITADLNQPDYLLAAVK